MTSRDMLLDLRPATKGEHNPPNARLDQRTIARLTLSVMRVLSRVNFLEMLQTLHIKANDSEITRFTSSFTWPHSPDPQPGSPQPQQHVTNDAWGSSPPHPDPSSHTTSRPRRHPPPKLALAGRWSLRCSVSHPSHGFVAASGVGAS